MKTSNRRVALTLFFAVLALYLAFPTKDYYWDGVGFALAIEHPASYGMIEGNHPIYIGFGWLFYEAIRQAFPVVRALSVLQWLNSIFAAMSVSLVYLLAEEFFENSLTGLLLAGAFATSATWWKFATDANAYMPAIFFLLASARLALASSKPRPLSVSLAHISAVLFHVLAVFFFLPAVFGLYGKDRRMRSPLIYLAVTSVVTSLAYYICYYLATGQTVIDGYLRWISQHTPDGKFSFDLGRNLMFTLRGALRLFLGGSVNLFQSGPLSVAILLGFWAAGFIWVDRKSRKEAPKPPALPASALWVWIAVYAAFLFWWMPQNTFYRLFYLPPLVLLAGQLFTRPKAPRIAFALLALTASWNFLFYIYPHSRAETNKVLSSANAMRPLWKPGTVVYQGSFNTDNWIVSYFNPQADFRTLGPSRLSQLESDLESVESTGHTAWIDQSATDLLAANEAGEQWLSNHTQPGSEHNFNDGKHRISFAQLHLKVPGNPQ